MNTPGMELEYTLKGHTNTVWSVCWSPDGRWLASASLDNTIRLWKASTGTLVRTLKGHKSTVFSVCWSPDGQWLASASRDKTIRLWKASTRTLVRTLEGHKSTVFSVCWSPDGKWLASGSGDKTIRLWKASTGALVRTLVGHRSDISSICWSPDGKWLASGSWDQTVRVWEAETGTLVRTLEGHTHYIHSIYWAPDGKWLASGSWDQTVRVWEAETGTLVRTLEGHTHYIQSVCGSSDGQWLASQSRNELRLWRTDTWESTIHCEETVHSSRTLSPHPWEARLAAAGPEYDCSIRIWKLDEQVLLGVGAVEAAVEYSNAKVVLVGDSGVGKSGLALVLRGEKFEPTLSTHARHVWTFQSETVEVGAKRKQQREVMLWDLAGQPGYRVYHQLHLSEVAVALVLFDASEETNPLAGVAYWAQALDEATKGFPLVKYLVAARIDRGSPYVSRDRIAEMCRRYGFAHYIETSALRGDNVETLAKTICEAIQWEKIAPISAPEVFYEVKKFLAQEKETGSVLRTREELRERYRQQSAQEVETALLDACIGRLEAAGLVRPLVFGNQILLQPELLDAYCAWLAQAAGQERDGLGYISEDVARRGTFPMDAKRPLAKRSGDEQTLLVAMVEEVVARRIAWRQQTMQGAMLVFPSELRTDMPDFPGGYTQVMTFRFAGPVRAIYATLAVCLLNSRTFTRCRLYQNAATFYGPGEQVCGFAVDYPDPTNDAQGRLTVFFDATATRDTKALFLRYVNEQLETLALEESVHPEPVYQCTNEKCKRPVIARDIVEEAKADRQTRVFCPRCGQPVFLEDFVQELKRKDARVEEIKVESQEEQERQQRLVTLDVREKAQQYDVFLSHNSKDKPEVRKLAQRLREEGLVPWLDEEVILAGDQFVPAMEGILDDIPVSLVLIGPHSLGRWQEQEYYVSLQNFVERRKQAGKKRVVLIPILLPGAPEEDQLDVPPFLRTFSRVDFREHGFDDPPTFRRLLKGILTQRET